MQKNIQSQAFPNVFLRLDGTGVTGFSGPGGGVANAQFTAGPYETFTVEAQPGGGVAFKSAAFPNVYLRLDGSGLTGFQGPGGGVANAQFTAGPWETFTLEPQPDGSTTVASTAFSGVYLRLDGTGVSSPQGAGGGVANGQFTAGPWEKFLIVDSAYVQLPVTLYPQLTDMWCWAASGEMIMAYGGNNVAQCTQANNRFGMQNCCNAPTPGACIQGGWPQFDAFGFNFQTTAWGTALTFAELTGQFQQNQPVAFSWGWTGGGGHMMVACGVDPSSNFVYMNDPWPPNTGGTRWISYDAYVSTPGQYTHWTDYYNISQQPGAPSPDPGAPAGSPSGAVVSGPGDSEGPSGPSPASGATAGHGAADAAAQQGLRLASTLPGAAAATPPAAPGAPFTPAPSVPPFPGNLKLGDPFKVVHVRRDALAQHEPGADPQRLLVDVGEWLYPALGPDGDVVSAIRVTERDTGWAVKSVGETALARDLVRVREADAAATGQPRGSYLIVHVPALYKIFVGRIDPKAGLVLLPVHSDPDTGMRSAVPGAGTDLLARLVPHARQGRSALDENGPGESRR
jgi:hypothetical protein